MKNEYVIAVTKNGTVCGTLIELDLETRTCLLTDCRSIIVEAPIDLANVARKGTHDDISLSEEFPSTVLFDVVAVLECTVRARRHLKTQPAAEGYECIEQPCDFTFIPTQKPCSQCEYCVVKEDK